jgi:hypothetical protein
VGKRDLPAEQIPVLVSRGQIGQTTGAELAKRDQAAVTAALDSFVMENKPLCYDCVEAAYLDWR